MTTYTFMLFCIIFFVAPHVFGSEEISSLKEILESDLLSPHKLKNRQLQLVLNGRGIDHTTVFDKQELEKLIKDSGPLTEKELEIAGDVSTVANLEAKLLKKASSLDSYLSNHPSQIKLVQIAGKRRSIVSNKTWHRLVEIAQASGILTKIFSYSVDQNGCTIITILEAWKTVEKVY